MHYTHKRLWVKLYFCIYSFPPSFSLHELIIGTFPYKGFSFHFCFFLGLLRNPCFKLSKDKVGEEKRNWSFLLPALDLRFSSQTLALYFFWNESPPFPGELSQILAGSSQLVTGSTWKDPKIKQWMTVWTFLLWKAPVEFQGGGRQWRDTIEILPKLIDLERAFHHQTEFCSRATMERLEGNKGSKSYLMYHENCL